MSDEMSTYRDDDGVVREAAEWLAGDWPSVMKGCDGTDEWFDKAAEYETLNAARHEVFLDEADVRAALVCRWAEM